MTPTDPNAFDHVRANLRRGVSTAATELQELFGLSFHEAMDVIDFVEEVNAPLYKPAQRVHGPEMAPGRKAALVGQAQAARVPRVPK